MTYRLEKHEAELEEGLTSCSPGFDEIDIDAATKFHHNFTRKSFCIGEQK